MKLFQLAALMNTGNTMPQRHHYRMPEPRGDRQRPTFEAYLQRARPQQRQPVAITESEAQPKPPVSQQETPPAAAPVSAPPAAAPVSAAPTEPINLEFFKRLREDASDTKYPLDGSKRRAEHESYARMLLDRARAAQSQIAAAAAAEGTYVGQSWAAHHNTFDQIFSALDEVERFMDDQAQRAAAGENVTLIEGRHRHLLDNALGKLYFEMKDYFNA